jgi:hypothetical protein
MLLKLRMKKKYPIVDAFKSESSNISPEYVCDHRILRNPNVRISNLMFKNVSVAKVYCSLLKS